MGCGCAGRLRSGLQLLKWEYDEPWWFNPKTSERIHDDEIEEHHTRIVAQVLAKQARAKANDARAFAARVFGSADN